MVDAVSGCKFRKSIHTKELRPPHSTEIGVLAWIRRRFNRNMSKSQFPLAEVEGPHPMVLEGLPRIFRRGKVDYQRMGAFSCVLVDRYKYSQAARRLVWTRTSLISTFDTFATLPNTSVILSAVVSDGTLYTSNDGPYTGLTVRCSSIRCALPMSEQRSFFPPSLSGVLSFTAASAFCTEA